jgi:hypothetical protein
MDLLLPTFKIVSVVFAISAVATGIQAMVNPMAFSRTFGLPLTKAKVGDGSKAAPISDSRKSSGNPIISYVSLMGVRQLATGITLLTFAYQGKWTEMATILSILGVVVAGTDGFYLSRSGARNLAGFHAIPGALIALLAVTVIFTST